MFSGQSIIDDTSEGGFLKSPQEEPTAIQPLDVELVGISITEVTKRASTIEIEFTVTNHNFKSVLLQFIKYELFESGQRIHIGEIGERPDSFVIGSNYFTVLSGQSTTLSDTITIKNTGNTPELWNALETDSAMWKVSGEAHFSLSSMTSGGENIVEFEFDS